MRIDDISAFITLEHTWLWAASMWRLCLPFNSLPLILAESDAPLHVIKGTRNTTWSFQNNYLLTTTGTFDPVAGGGGGVAVMGEWITSEDKKTLGGGWYLTHVWV